jgi:hypothetical protein
MSASSLPRILVSLPVHEQPAVVRDQIANIQKYNPGATVVLHISREFIKRRWLPLGIWQSERVLINPVRQSTAKFGLLPIHLSNYQYAKSHGSFDRFVIHASNDMYVKSGAGAFMAKFDANVRPVPVNLEGSWVHLPRLRQHQYLSALAAHLGNSPVCASTPEGTAYSSEFMEEALRLLIDRFPYEASPDPYPDEETVLPTIAHALGVSRGLPFLASELTLGRPVTEAEVRQVREGALVVPQKTFFDSTETYEVYDPANIFAVKRVARQMNDPLRTFIRSLPA